MILYFERKADKDGRRRLEVTVEEFEVQAGKRYLATFYEKDETGESRAEDTVVSREGCIRWAIAWFDEKRSDLWPDEASSPS